MPDNKENPNPLDFLDEPEKPAALILTDAQKLAILKAWQENYDSPPSIEELCEICWSNKKYDGRSKYGRLIKEYLVSQNLKATTKTEYKNKELPELTDEMKEFVRNNLNMKNHEMAQILFEKAFLTATSVESRAIGAYRDELRKKGVIKDDNGEEVTEKYNPPKTLDRVCARVNRNIEGANFDYRNLTPTQKKQCLALISYLHNMRFAHQMDLIGNFDDRKLLENTFIKYIYDKPDLTQEDLDQYIILANEAVMASSISRTISMLEREQERSLNEDGKISMTIVEALKTSRDEYNSCIKRQQSLYKSLTEERSKRLSERIGNAQSLLNLIETWKQKESRDKMIKLAEERKQKLSNEVNRLETMDDLKCKIMGISKEEILEG